MAVPSMRPGRRVRLAWWLLQAASRLALGLAGQPAFGRWLLRAAVAHEATTATRTAAGPDGEPDAGTPDEPLGGAIHFEIPAGLLDLATLIRWACEERKRADEAFLFDRADALQAWLIRHPNGPCYTLENRLEELECQVTGAAEPDRAAPDIRPDPATQIMQR